MPKNILIHPEVGQLYLKTLADTTRTRKDLHYESARMLAFVTTWNECQKQTHEILEQLMPIEEVTDEDILDTIRKLDDSI